MTILHKLLGRRDARQTDPLPGRERPPRAWTRACVGAASDRGQTREENEDAFCALSAAVSQNGDALWLRFGAVADGLGGQEKGQLASALATRLVADWVMDRVYRPLLGEPVGRTARQPISEVLTEAFGAAHQQVRRACPHGGTTLTCALVLGSTAFVAHVGDSRAYLIEADAIRQLTTDHSMVSRLIQVGTVSPQEARTHPQRSMLYRALGRPGELQVDTRLQPLPGGSALLLCSDGLWSLVPESEMRAIIARARSAQEACEDLVARANACGGDDNITAVLVVA